MSPMAFSPDGSLLAFSPDGSLLACISRDQTVRLWNPCTGKAVQRLQGHTDYINAFAFSPDGSLLASASSDKTVRLWNPRTGQAVQTLDDVPVIQTIGFTIDNKALITNRGAISLTGESTYNAIMIRDNWVRKGNRNFLWLPQEYRSAITAFYGNIFVFGLSSGQVSFIQLDITPRCVCP
jgi:WD40 repeat protein